MNQRILRVHHCWSRQRIGAYKHVANCGLRLPVWMLQQHSLDTLWGWLSAAAKKQAAPDGLVTKLRLHLAGVNPRCRRAQ